MSDAQKAHEGPAWLEGKDTRMTVLSKEPLVLETPVSLLAGQRITDKQFLFVRHIQDLAEGMTMDPMPLARQRHFSKMSRQRCQLAICAYDIDSNKWDKIALRLLKSIRA